MQNDANSARPANPPAFPGPVFDRGGLFEGNNEGMTLRDYDAIRLVPVVLAINPDWRNYYTISVEAYAFADAMLAARERGQ